MGLPAGWAFEREHYFWRQRLEDDGFRVQLSWYGRPCDGAADQDVRHLVTLFGCDVVSSATLFSFGVQGVLLSFVLLN